MTKDDFKFYAPYFGTLFVLIGAIKLIIYYSLFNLDVTSYIEFTEILTLFIKDLLTFLLNVLASTLIMFLFQPNSELESISNGIHDTLTEPNLFKRLYAYSVNGINLIILTLIWILGIPFWLWLSKFTFITYLYLICPILAVFILLTITYETRRQWYIKYNEYPKIIYAKLAYLLTLLIAISIFSAYQDFKDVREGKRFLGTTIKLVDRVLISDSNYYYIGKTRNFIFIHNQTKETNDIIPMSEVKMLTLKINSRINQ